MKNSQVAQAWANNKTAQTGTMRTDGENLYSYRLVIGTTNEQGEKVALQYSKSGNNFVSMTTSKHVSYTNRYADKQEIPQTSASRY